VLQSPVIPKYRAGLFYWKAWLLPDGRVVSCDGFHQRWLHVNLKNLPAGLQKQLADLGNESSEQADRLAALDHGFFRINYNYNRGWLTIEGDSRFLNQQAKKSLFDFVKTNISNIVGVTMSLFNQGRFHDTKEVKLFMLNSDEERLRALPFIHESSAQDFLRLV
jgi:hypothetical protein